MNALNISIRHPHQLIFTDILSEERQQRCAVSIIKEYSKAPLKIFGYLQRNSKVLLTAKNGRHNVYVKVDVAVLADRLELTPQDLIQEMSQKSHVNEVVRRKINALNREILVEAIERKEKEKACHFADQALKNGDGELAYVLAKEWERKQFGTKQESIKWLKKAAEEWHAEASYELGLYYINRNRPGDLLKGINCIREAALFGSSEAESYLESLREECMSKINKESNI